MQLPPYPFGLTLSCPAQVRYAEVILSGKPAALAAFMRFARFTAKFGLSIVIPCTCGFARPVTPMPLPPTYFVKRYWYAAHVVGFRYCADVAVEIVPVGRL